MQLSEVNPVVSSNLGWDVNAAQDEQMVTFVKRSVVYSEVTLPKSEYLKMMNDTYPDEYYREKIEPKMVTDDVMEDFGQDENKYVTFAGDISTMTDDVLAMSDYEWEWTPGNNGIQKVTI